MIASGDRLVARCSTLLRPFCLQIFARSTVGQLFTPYDYQRQRMQRPAHGDAQLPSHGEKTAIYRIRPSELGASECCRQGGAQITVLGSNFVSVVCFFVVNRCFANWNRTWFQPSSSFAISRVDCCISPCSLSLITSHFFDLNPKLGSTDGIRVGWRESLRQRHARPAHAQPEADLRHSARFVCCSLRCHACIAPHG